MQGFYVDVGAHHAYRFSNTYWAYRKGWSGVCIDAAPGFAKKFEQSRPRDVAVECCITESSGHTDFYVFPEQALNTTNPVRESVVRKATGELAKVISVETEPLANILSKHLPPHVDAIDFMSIDIEGGELAALRSNNWLRFKPRVLVLEALGRTLFELDSSPEVIFLRSQGFTPVAMLYHSVVFISDQSLINEHWPAAHRVNH